MAVAEPYLSPLSVAPPQPVGPGAGRTAVRRTSIVDRIGMAGAIGITVLAIVTPWIAPYDPNVPVGAEHVAARLGLPARHRRGRPRHAQPGALRHAHSRGSRRSS